jgi:hypothetical protein
MKIKFLLACLAIPLFLACSEQDSEKVDITFSPENPRVRFADGKVQTGFDTSTNLPVFTDIPAPWFSFTAVIQNGSDKNVVVESLKLKMLGLTATQGMLTLESTLTAESFLDAVAPLPEVIATVTAGTTSPSTLSFYISGLSPAVTSGVYNVEVHAEGWFGTIDEPGAVFSQKYFFTTR